MSYINVTGTYSAIKFLPSGNMELVFEIPFRQKGGLLRGIDEITAAGLPELSIKAEKKLRNGTGWLVKVVDSKLDGCKKVFAYYGSSVYDTKEMSRLIDSVIEDCRALNIETMPPAELDMLLKEWGRNTAERNL